MLSLMTFILFLSWLLVVGSLPLKVSFLTEAMYFISICSFLSMARSAYAMILACSFSRLLYLSSMRWSSFFSYSISD
jgi:hypothetical protein